MEPDDGIFDFSLFDRAIDILYKLVVAPMLFIMNDDIAQRLKDYVKEGGTLVLTVRSGIREWSDITTLLPWPGILSELAGIKVTEFDSLPPQLSNSITYKDIRYKAHTFWKYSRKIQQI